MNAAKLTFKKVAPRIYVASADVALLRADGFGAFETRITFRLDGRKRGFYRADMADFSIWEAIDGGESSAPKTLREGKAFVQRYFHAIRAQGTMHPSIEREAA